LRQTAAASASEDDQLDSAEKARALTSISCGKTFAGNPLEARRAAR